MIKAYIKYWKKAGDLKSYSNRSDYWWVFLTNSIIFAILSILNFMVTIPKAGKIMSQSATLSQKEIIYPGLNRNRKDDGSIVSGGESNRRRIRG